VSVQVAVFLECFFGRAKDDHVSRPEELLFPGLDDGCGVCADQAVAASAVCSGEGIPAGPENPDSRRRSGSDRPAFDRCDLVDEGGDDHWVDCLQSVGSQPLHCLPSVDGCPELVLVGDYLFRPRDQSFGIWDGSENIRGSVRIAVGSGGRAG
jgi:hypothetical protein